jgi:hypothetical protein
MENWTEPAHEPKQADRPSPTGPGGTGGGSEVEGKFEKRKCGF